MDIEYVDILTGEKLSSILVANMYLIYWSVRSFIRRGGICLKGSDEDIVILGSCMYYFIRVHENLV